MSTYADDARNVAKMARQFKRSQLKLAGVKIKRKPRRDRKRKEKGNMKNATGRSAGALIDSAVKLTSRKGIIPKAMGIVGGMLAATAKAMIPGLDFLGTISTLLRDPVTGRLPIKVTQVNLRCAEIHGPRVYESPGDVVFRQYISPHYFDGTRIQVQQDTWQRYKFTEVVVEYVPAANKTQTGQLIGFFDTDPDDIPAPGAAGINHAQAHGGTMFQISEHATFSMPMSNLLLWTGPVDVNDRDAVKLKVQGCFYVLAVTDLPDSSALGSFQIAYKCHFEFPNSRNDNGGTVGDFALYEALPVTFTSELGNLFYTMTKENMPRTYGTGDPLVTDVRGGSCIRLGSGVWYLSLAFGLVGNLTVGIRWEDDDTEWLPIKYGTADYSILSMQTSAPDTLAADFPFMAFIIEVVNAPTNADYVELKPNLTSLISTGTQLETDPRCSIFACKIGASSSINRVRYVENRINVLTRRLEELEKNKVIEVANYTSTKPVLQAPPSYKNIK